MSWMKKRGQNASPAAPPPQVQMYNPNQHSNQENEWQAQTQETLYNQQAWQQPPYQQNYNQPPQQYYQNNEGYQQQQHQQHYTYNQQYAQNYAPPQEGDGWGSNWGWGDEDNSNIQTPQTNQVAESFANNETWNWQLDPPEATKPEPPTKTKLETPQWSLESQMSQESSDDVLQTSESDKSRMLSRSSTISHEEEAHPPENKEILFPPSQTQRHVPTAHANLETVPDNAEQPDLLPPTVRITTSLGAWPDNLEAPINDRNQYLETAQLSDVDFNRAVESQDDLVPPPPPGLRRMVPGEGGGAVNEPPEGLRRMVPGESSSPETGGREVREATIGADTPPVVGSGRSETIGADAADSELVGAVRNLTIEEREGSDGGEREESEREKTPERKERRYREKEGGVRDRGRGRYSPDDYNERRRFKEKRYEEDTDYSDKERRHKEERKYNSLRKDKDKDRRRGEYERDHRRKGGDYYYSRYDDEFDNEPRSRASSRSDSMHDSYRRDERERRERRHREKDRHRRHRTDPFNPYQGFGYDIYSQYYQQYQYYENLRKTNPQAYAQLYRKYYQNADHSFVGGAEDRASVHSGRSSANDELAKDRYTRQSYYSQASLPMGGYYRGSQSISGQYGLDESSYTRTLDHPDTSIAYEDQTLTSQRLTPAKFATAHLKASITSGKLVKILPHYPLDGQSAIVELCNLETFLYCDEDYQELRRFPGPLIKGTTHKKTIIEYCESKIKLAGHNIDINDRDSYVLMWELLILLIRQNGMVVGADIAELLLKSEQDHAQRPPSTISSAHSEPIDERTTPLLKEDEITNKFRENLLYGSDKEALEWAMKHGLWGHALFLASKLDKRTYANVLMRFANGLAMNDPLQTLYQLLSGRTPAAVTCVADEKWGDWRPHLAMILSNSTHRPDLNCKAITLLGDTLLSRGSLFAAQFCYLMSEVSFGQYGSEAKLVLLGADPRQEWGRFATNEAIHMTEVYEYARSLNDDDFTLPNFQRFKYILSTRLADVGLLEKSLSYLEKISNFIVKNPSLVEVQLIDNVVKMADRLKYYDPVGDGDDGDFDTSRADNSWLNDLRRVEKDLNMGLISHESKHEPVPDDVATNQDIWQQQQQWNQQPETIPTTIPQQNDQADGVNYGQYQQEWQAQGQWNDYSAPTAYQTQETNESNYYGNQILTQNEENAPPQISLPNQKLDEMVEQPMKKPQAPPQKQDVRRQQQNGNGWFGGIFNKLSLKPKNQIKLPDDKNPTIVWDADKKRWVNTDADGGDVAADFKPPPKMAELKKPPILPTPNINGGAGKPPAIPPENMFKLQKNLKKSYIDVFNSGKVQGGGALPPPVENLGAGFTPTMNFFVPQPISDPNAPTDFLTPAPPINLDEIDSQMSRWSSASSLSREVQSYTMPKSKFPTSGIMTSRPLTSQSEKVFL